MEGQEQCDTTGLRVHEDPMADILWLRDQQLFNKCGSASCPELWWVSRNLHQMCRSTTPIPSGGLCDVLPYYPA